MNSEDPRLAFPGEGGRYEIRDGKRVRVEESTKDHPEGNRPRDKDGRPLDGLTGQPAEAPAPEPAPSAGVTSIRSSRKPAIDD